MQGLLYPTNWAIQRLNQGKVSYEGKNGLRVRNAMELTTKQLMTFKGAQAYSDLKGGKPFDVDALLLDGAE